MQNSQDYKANINYSNYKLNLTRPNSSIDKKDYSYVYTFFTKYKLNPNKNPNLIHI